MAAIPPAPQGPSASAIITEAESSTIPTAIISFRKSATSPRTIYGSTSYSCAKAIASCVSVRGDPSNFQINEAVLLRL